jgi:hypothetical protein
MKAKIKTMKETKEIELSVRENIPLKIRHIQTPPLNQISITANRSAFLSMK